MERSAFVGAARVGWGGAWRPVAACARRPRARVRGRLRCAAEVADGFEAVAAQLEGAQEAAMAKVAASSSSEELQAVRVAYLGKKGEVTSVLKSLGKMGKEQRPKVGALVNQVKAALEEALDRRKEEIAEEELNAEMAGDSVDVTMPGIYNRRQGNIHPLTSTIDKAVDIFLELGYELIDDPELSPEVETEYYCFEALNTPDDHPSRDMQDTFFLEGEEPKLLRTHTSAVQVRYMERNKPPFAIVCPGRVYRRDTVDATHSALFHQVEIMAIQKDLNLGNLKGTITHFLKRMFGEEVEVRYRGSFFPFTEPSMEVDVFFRGKWLEVLGCGMVDPAVLEKAGLDPDEWQGFAAGFGVERFAMVIHEIPDIRELYKSDARFLKQFVDGYESRA